MNIWFIGCDCDMLKNLKSRFDALFASLVVFLSCFVLMFLVGSFVIQVQDSKAVSGLSLANAPQLVLSASSSLELEAVPGMHDGMASGVHSVLVATDVPTGYVLALSTSGVPSLVTTDGTYATPSVLMNNTWGYALAGVGGFDAGYATPTPSAISRWADPSTYVAIKNTSTSTTGDITDVYYGTKVDMSLPSGTYANAVRYTAAANIASIAGPTIVSVAPSFGTAAGGTAIEIIGTNFTVNDKSITIAVAVGGLACTDVSISSNVPATGQDTIYCNTPMHAAGAADVSVTTWSSTVTSANAFMYVAPANVTFVSPSMASTIPGTESGPVFTIAGTDFTGATYVAIGGTACASFEVVSDTHIFCKAPNTINTVGAKTISINKVNGAEIISSTSTESIVYSDTVYPTFQASDAFAQCGAVAKLYRDTRDSQLYYVKKMADDKCWMVDNLKYANFGDLSQENGKFLTVDGTNAQSTGNSDVAMYADPGAASYCTGSANMPANVNTRCGLLYNWYAATNGSGTYSINTAGANVTGSICPADFRLPSATSDGLTATGTGDDYGRADIAVLNASMLSGYPMVGSVLGNYMNWYPSGAWGGVFSGNWGSALSNQGSYGYYWSSTILSVAGVRSLYFGGNSLFAGNTASVKSTGYAVRCVMEMVPPEGSNPSNISSTNPAVLDVYPTTGWAGETISISSNAWFTDVGGVTIGGTSCASWGVVNTSLITCNLPVKIAGTANDIAVINNGVNVIDINTYKHMRVTYFNPASSTVVVGGATYNYYPSGFTSTNCSALIIDNSPVITAPISSMAYFRDTRNRQVYKVRRLADGKCWMADNLKYITTSMTYNNGDHKNNGGTTAFNTADETSTQNYTNNDRAFYNNPMGVAYCYGLSATIPNTMTSCGYLYNWYAATNGSGRYYYDDDGENVSGNICPANFRLPSALSGSTATNNGVSYGVADFAVLNASMNAGSLAVGSNLNYFTNWRPTGAWGGTYSSFWNNTYIARPNGYFWSSTAYSALNARSLDISINNVDTSLISSRKYDGLAVRCVLP